eukprot:TRINITY_DN66429_c0_g1_i1.p1 TRINITY_DN66429_c0_g1~~TRINITY_DN66429_c0_g1_i1.p1  ORF type:complete len:362 (+),score=113.81 TRINITY_DN66429_c0_g1_i1:80-1087(+)
MALFAVHEVPIQRTYSSGGFWSSLLVLAGLVVCVFIPFIVVYATGLLWLRNVEYSEQPEVAYLNKAVIALRANTSDLRPLVWSSLDGGSPVATGAPATAEDLLGSLYTLPFVEYYGEDRDTDGKVDRAYFDATFDLPDGFKVAAVDAVLFFQWDASQVIRISMETAIPCSVTSGGAAMRSAEVTADLGWWQRQPLTQNRFMRYDVIYNQSLTSKHLVRSAADLDIGHIQRRYGSRNQTTPLRVRSSSWLPAFPGSTTFEFSLRLDVPPVDIAYNPRFATALKFGIVQYFVFVFIFSKVWTIIAGAIVELGIVDTVASCPELEALQRFQTRPRLSY